MTPGASVCDTRQHFYIQTHCSLELVVPVCILQRHEKKKHVVVRIYTRMYVLFLVHELR